VGVGRLPTVEKGVTMKEQVEQALRVATAELSLATTPEALKQAEDKIAALKKQLP